MMEDDSMVAYSIVNMYIMGIQAGIQAAHSQTEMIALEAESGNPQANGEFNRWFSNPTMIIKNGGNAAQMDMLCNRLCGQTEFSWGYHGEDGLGGILTSLTILMPRRRVLESATTRTKCPESDFVARFVNGLRLAR